MKSDAGFQVERTALSWLRTLFVSALIMLSIAKILHGSLSWCLAVSLLSSCVTCSYMYLSALGVATKKVTWKANKHKVIVISLALSALFYGGYILFR